MAKCDTLFMTKTAENPYIHFGAARTYIVHTRAYPLGKNGKYYDYPPERHVHLFVMGK